MTQTVKMQFQEDQKVDGQVLYAAGELVNVPVEKRHFWQLRGGQLIEETADAKETEAVDTQEDVEKRKPGRPAKKA